MTGRAKQTKRALRGCLYLGLGLGIAGIGYSQDKPAVEEPGRSLVSPLPRAMPRPEGDVEAMPIDWPAVLELARASNLEIQLAVEKVQEAHAQVALAKSQWMPSLKVGTTWLHHDGQIQDIPGNIFDTSKSSLFNGGIAQVDFEPQKAAVDVLRAKQQVYARAGALDRATRQTLHDCSIAYIDLVAAQAGAAISLEIASLIQELVDRSEQLLKQGVGNQVDVLRNQAMHRTQQQKLLDARQNQLAASAQLVQLLNLPPGTRLFANEEKLIPVRLVNEQTPEPDLVAQALDQGPGLTEVQALLTALEKQKAQLRRLALLPSVSVNVGQGAFGGGFGSSLQNFDSRTDVGVNVYWDVLKVVGNSRAQSLFESQRRQALLQHDQVTSKLAAGVIVALNSARQAQEKIKLAETEIQVAIQSYELSHARLKAAETLSFEVLQAIGSLGTARADYLMAVIEYNKAQIQLQYLVGSHYPAVQPGSCSENRVLLASPGGVEPMQAEPIPQAQRNAEVHEPVPAPEAKSTSEPVRQPEASPKPEALPVPEALPTAPVAPVNAPAIPAPPPASVIVPTSALMPPEHVSTASKIATAEAPTTVTPALKRTSELPTLGKVAKGSRSEQELNLKYKGRWPSSR